MLIECICLVASDLCRFSTESRFFAHNFYKGTLAPMNFRIRGRDVGLPSPYRPSLNLNIGERNMGMYKYLAEAWKKPKDTLSTAYKNYLVEWRQDPVTLRLEHPTRLDRARALGYKAKQGYFVVRQRVTSGGKMRPKPAGGRQSKKYSRQHVVHVNYQTIAERRANDKFVNCEVLNSYWVGKDGNNYWYEVIMVDTKHPVIVSDPNINWICSQTRRAYRGLTSAHRKSRGMRHKGIGTEKARPSLRANKGLLH